jgi:DNA replication protein DnaC
MFRAPDLERFHDRLSRELIDACPDCRGTGFLRGTVELEDAEPWETASSRCHCAEEVQFRVTLLGAHVPREFWRVEGLKFTRNVSQRAQVEEYVDDLGAARASGAGWLFIGQNGTGKTACGCVVLCRAARAGFSIGYLTAQEFVASAIAASRDPELGAWRSSLLAADFLFLDELGKEYRKEGSEFALAELDGLLRWRRGELRPTVIATNASVAELQTWYGESFFSILNDRAKRLQFTPGDFRNELARRGK